MFLKIHWKKEDVAKKALEKFGGQVYCFMADEDVAEKAKESGVTRATISMEKSAQMNEDFIYAIGNAPTALISLYN